MDGVGDNADVFPNDPDESSDSDSDGVGDNADAFPNDSSETVDTDMDGVGIMLMSSRTIQRSHRIATAMVSVTTVMPPMIPTNPSMLMAMAWV